MDLKRWQRWWKAQGERELRALLMEQWDPIHVRDQLLAQDEYDGYIGPLASMLRKGTATDAVAEYLSDAERQMGFSTKPEQLHDVASRVTDWYASATRP